MTTRVDRDVREAARDFLFLEALYLDERRWREWLALWSDDAVYEVPVRVTREKGAEWELSPVARIFDDTKETLEVRVKRLETEFAWAEQPPSRTRHFVTNVLVEATATDGEILARSNCLVYRSRGAETTPSLISLQRRDTLRHAGGEWRIARRWAAIDQAVVNAHNLSIFL